MPFVSPLNRRQYKVVVIRMRSIRGIGPGDLPGQELDNFPMRKEDLRLICIRELQWSQMKTDRFEFRCHRADRFSRCSLIY